MSVASFDQWFANLTGHSSPRVGRVSWTPRDIVMTRLKSRVQPPTRNIGYPHRPRVGGKMTGKLTEHMHGPVAFSASAARPGAAGPGGGGRKRETPMETAVFALQSSHHRHRASGEEYIPQTTDTGSAGTSTKPESQPWST